MVEFGLRNDVYRRPLVTALDRLGIAPGWVCADVGAGAGDVSVELARIVGRSGRVYAIDSDPRARDETAAAAARSGEAQILAITQDAEDLVLPEQVDMAFCRFLLMHVARPSVVLERMARIVKPQGFVVAQEPITTAGRVGGVPLSMPFATHEDVGAELPALFLAAGCTIIDSWAESQVGVGEGPVSSYLEALTEVNPGNESIVLPPLVTVIGRRADVVRT